MQTVGVEPQLASVAVYQAGKLIAPATRAGAEANDIYIQDKKGHLVKQDLILK